MSARTPRPTFFEGQILGADDLTASVEYARVQAARHGRFAHTPGVLSGLTLDLIGQTVRVRKGYAIDDLGRELVLVDDYVLTYANFKDAEDARPNDAEKHPYPIFLNLRSQPVAPRSGAGGGCAASLASSTRTDESPVVSVGQQGEIEAGYNRDAAAIAFGEPPLPSDTFRVPLGKIVVKGGKIDSIDLSGRRLAGVRAGEVITRGDFLDLHAANELGIGPSIRLTNQPTKTHVEVGITDAAGKIAAPVVDVDIAGKNVTIYGNVDVKGTVQSFVSGDKPVVQSGTAFDGTVIPLPPGVTPAQLATLNADFHVMLTSRVESMPAALQTVTGMFVREMFLDSDYRVHCLVAWAGVPTNGGPAIAFDEPGVCDYLSVLVVKP